MFDLHNFYSFCERFFSHVLLLYSTLTKLTYTSIVRFSVFLKAFSHLKQVGALDFIKIAFWPAKSVAKTHILRLFCVLDPFILSKLSWLIWSLYKIALTDLSFKANLNYFKKIHCHQIMKFSIMLGYVLMLIF